jgi:GT2 family glycosyltransferase
VRRTERPGFGDDVTDRRAHLCDVVIPTRNRPTGLVRCLEGLLNQTMQDFGVVVVDDCSDTPLREIVEQKRFAELDITLVELPQQSGPAAARNAGVDRVTAELLIFLDDDVLPDRRFLAAHLETVGGTARSAVPIVSCGPFVEPADWDPTPWNLWEARQAKKEADAMLRFVPTWRQFHTGNNCLPTAAFRKVGGFNESYKRAEDDEFALRLHIHGCHFRFQPAAIAYHYSNRTLDAWLAIPRAYAYYHVQIDRLHPYAGYLAARKRDLGRRRLPLRLARAACRGARRTELGVASAVAAARALFRLGRINASMGALSVAYDLTYVQSLREAETAPAGMAA